MHKYKFFFKSITPRFSQYLMYSFLNLYILYSFNPKQINIKKYIYLLIPNLNRI